MNDDDPIKDPVEDEETMDGKIPGETEDDEDDVGEEDEGTM